MEKVSQPKKEATNPLVKRGAKVGFSPTGKKQVPSLKLLTIDEILAIIWQMGKNSPKNKIKFPKIAVTFVHLVCYLMPGRLVLTIPCAKGRTN